jgi:hypothetical protein
MGWGKQIGVVPDCCRRIRVGQGGTIQAKQGKKPMSTSTAPCPATAVFRTVIGSAGRCEAVVKALLCLHEHYYRGPIVLFDNMVDLNRSKREGIGAKIVVAAFC